MKGGRGPGARRQFKQDESGIAAVNCTYLNEVTREV
jgi:hypothetical protein